jgi:hypothetical protein
MWCIPNTEERRLMSILIDKRTGFQILRLTSESISEPETNQIIDSVRSGLSEGIRCQAISLKVALSSNIMIMGLLVICEKMMQRFGGHLGLIVNPECNESGLRTLCDSLNIAVYDNKDAFMVSSAAFAAAHEEGDRLSQQQQPDFINPSKELYMDLQPVETAFTTIAAGNQAQ